MKTYEKIMKLDADYVEARKKLMLGQAESVELTVHLKKSEPAALLKKPKNAVKSSTETNSQ